MGMDIEDFDIVQFRGLHDPGKFIGHTGGGVSVRIAVREIDGLHDGESPTGVSEAGHSYIGDALHDPVIALIGLCEGSSGKDSDPYPSLGSFFHFLCP